MKKVFIKVIKLKYLLCVLVGLLCHTGNLYALDTEWLPKMEKLAKQGNADAQFKLGAVYLIGADKIKNQPKGLELLQKSADQGDVNAQFFLGSRFVEGTEVPRNVSIGMVMLEKAANQGSIVAQEYLVSFIMKVIISLKIIRKR